MTKRRMRNYDRAFACAGAIACFSLTDGIYEYAVLLAAFLLYGLFNFFWGMAMGYGDLDE